MATAHQHVLVPVLVPVELIEELVVNGLPASNAELREMLLPVFEDIPDDPPPSPNLEQVLKEIDRYLDSRLPSFPQ